MFFCTRYKKNVIVLINLLYLDNKKGGHKMDDSKGKKITIGDRVKVLWGFNNRLYTGRIINIKESVVTVATINSNISTIHSKVTKVN